jgi:hypothetical protein
LNDAQWLYDVWKSKHTQTAEGKVTDILKDAETCLKRGESLRSLNESAQRAAFEQKLLAKAMKKRGSAGQLTEGTPLQQPSSESASPPPQEPNSQATLAWADSPSLHFNAFEGTPESFVEAFHSGQILVPTAMESAYTDTVVYLAQVYRAQGVSPLACYYCHLSLQRTYDSKADAEAQRAWLDNALELCRFYVSAADLSHAEYCLAAIDAVAPSKGKNEQFDATRVLLGGMVAYSFVKLMERECAALHTTTLDGCDLTLFSNPHNPPEDELNLPEDQRRKAAENGSWTKPERLGLGLPISNPRTTVRVHNTGAELRAYYEKAVACFEEAMKSPCLSMSTDCENSLRLRMKYSDLIGVMCTRTDVTTKEERIQLRFTRNSLLQSILSEKLDETVFRNVLRQTHYELASLALDRVTLGDVTSEAAVLEVLNYGVQQIETFTNRFEYEVTMTESATGKKHSSAGSIHLEGSDVPAYALGLLKHGYILLRYPTTPAQKKAASKQFQKLLTFLQANKKGVDEYPSLKETADQCKQLIELLESNKDIPAIPSTVVLPVKKSISKK